MLKGLAMYTGLDHSNEELTTFFNKIKDQPIDFIFTSFHISEAKCPSVEFLLNLLKDTNIKLVVDFSKKRYDEFGYNEYIIPRLDYGFSIDNILEMLKVHDLIELNASVINIDLLVALKLRKADFSKIRVSFNFYPKPLTGMSIDDVKAKIKLYHEFGLKVIIYIPCENKRGPLYLGLPSIEEFRMQTFKQNVEDAILLDVDGICVGDSLINDEELAILLKAEKKKDDALEIPITLLKNLNKEELEILKKDLVIRCDESPILVRSSSTRGINVKPHNTKKVLKRGSIIIDNNRLLRYSGEVSLLKQAAINDGQMNLVGYTDFKPELIKGGSRIRFKF